MENQLPILTAILGELRLIRTIMMNTDVTMSGDISIDIERELEQYEPENGNRLKSGWSEDDE